MIAFDTTTVVGDSVKEVVTTLEEAVLIVIIVIFLFLLDWRATIIPAVTIPVSLIGTFAFIKIFGFSINSLTLFGITLATGLVVDDAIVVIENAQRHIDADHTDPHAATSAAMAEVASAVVATSLVLISVFVPVSFFPGTTGILYKQFSLTIAFSIAISLFNALTLSPALAAILLRSEEQKYSMLRLDAYRLAFDADTGSSLTVSTERFTRLANAYGKAICRVLNFRYAMIVAVPCRTGRHRLHVRSRSDRIRAAGRPELLHRRGAGAAGSFALLHHEYCPASGADSARRSRRLRHVCRSRLFAFRRQFVELWPGVCSAETDRRPQRQRVTPPATSWRASRRNCLAFRERSWLHSSRRRSTASAASADSSSNCKTWVATRLQDIDTVAHKIVAGSRQRQDLTRTVHQLHCQRSAAVGADRSREGESHRSAHQPDYAGAGRLHGFRVRERF